MPARDGDSTPNHEAEISAKSCNGWSLNGKTLFGGAVVGRERPRLSPHDDSITDGQLLSARHTILSCNPGFVPSKSVRWRCKFTETHTTTPSKAVAVPDQQLCHHFSPASDRVGSAQPSSCVQAHPIFPSSAQSCLLLPASVVWP